jgi:hypothetical protein
MVKGKFTKERKERTWKGRKIECAVVAVRARMIEENQNVMDSLPL